MTNPIGPVTVPSYPGRVVAVTASDSTRFAPSVIVLGSPGVAHLIPAIPNGATAIVWTTTAENFVVPGLYVGVNATSLTASDVKRVQVNE
jgi:hypothetical protein